MAIAQSHLTLQLVQKGRRLVAAGRLAEGLALYEQALAAQPALAEAHLAAGIVLDLMGRYADARKHLTRAIELAPPEIKANALNAMATSYVFERRTADAAKFFQQVYDLDVAGGRPAARSHRERARPAVSRDRRHCQRTEVVRDRLRDGETTARRAGLSAGAVGAALAPRAGPHRRSPG